MKIMVCDFDGTLIQSNSFPVWMLSLVRGFWKERKFLAGAHVIALILFRKLGLIGHREFKERSIVLAEHLENDYVSEKLSRMVNPSVLDLFNAFEGVRVISSAAPVSYLESTVKRIGADASRIFGSGFVSGEFFENYSENKVRSLKNAYGDDLEITLVTDHHEDLPLMKIASKTYLVSPSEETLRVVSENQVEFFRV